MVKQTEQTTREQLFSYLYEACNILHGPINADEYKSYVIPLLFFKRISDVYDEETENALAESDNDAEYAALPDNHRFVIPDGCHWQDVREQTINIGLAIVNAMTGIERANPDTLSGMFSSFDDANWTDKTKLSDERLKDLVEHMSAKKVGNNNYSNDVMGDSYEYLLKKFADLAKKNAGEFYTPRSIVRLLVRILAPKAGETIYDPACGTGGMLIEAIHYISNDTSTYGKIYGQENNLSTSAIARMNLFLHGGRDFNIAHGDTLRSPRFLYRGELQTFDCVIANPPFSLKNWGADAFLTDIYGRNMFGCPTDSNGDFAWLQHMIKSMDPKNGRCAVILSQGVLYRGGKEAEMRRKLVESDKLEAIINLASGVFYRTGVNACALILNNNKPESRRGKIVLVDASNIYTAKRAQNVMEDKDIDAVYELYKNYTDVPEKSKVVTIQDIADHDWTLAVNNYIERKAVESVSPAVVKQEFLQTLNEVKLLEQKFKQLLVDGGYINE